MSPHPNRPTSRLTDQPGSQPNKHMTSSQICQPTNRRRRTPAQAGRQLQICPLHKSSLPAGQQPIKFTNVPRHWPAARMEPFSTDPADVPYFEREVLNRCGLHALNHAKGSAFFTAEDMESALEAYLVEMTMEGCPETGGQHIYCGGWYSLELMAFVVRWKIAHLTLGKLWPLSLDVQNPIQPHNAMRIYDPCCLGIILNKLQHSWVTFRMFKEQIWLLDSTALPKTVSYDEYVDFLITFNKAFALVILTKTVTRLQTTHRGLCFSRMGWPKSMIRLCRTLRCPGRLPGGARIKDTGALGSQVATRR